MNEKIQNHTRRALVYVEDALDRVNATIRECDCDLRLIPVGRMKLSEDAQNQVQELKAAILSLGNVRKRLEKTIDEMEGILQ